MNTEKVKSAEAIADKTINSLELNIHDKCPRCHGEECSYCDGYGYIYNALGLATRHKIIEAIESERRKKDESYAILEAENKKLRTQLHFLNCETCEPIFCCGGLECGCYGMPIDFKHTDKCQQGCTLKHIADLEAEKVALEGRVKELEAEVAVWREGAVPYVRQNKDLEAELTKLTAERDVEIKRAREAETRLAEACRVRDDVKVTCGCGKEMGLVMSGKTDDLFICPNKECKPGQVNLDFNSPTPPLQKGCVHDKGDHWSNGGIRQMQTELCPFCKTK